MSTIRCTVTNCRCISRALCYVCHENFCREHFDVHDHSYNSLLKSLNDKIKDFDDRLEDFNNEELIENCYEKLDKWRDDCYKTIDQLYAKKCQEIKRRFHENIDRRQERIVQLQTKVTNLLQEEDVTKTSVNSLLIDVEGLEEEMNKLEQIILHIDIQPLILDNKTITIEEINTTHFNLTQITHPYHSIDCSNHLSKPLASNEQYLLIYRMQNLCLIDRELTLVKQVSWSHNRIWDTCWSSTLNCFIILAHYEVYLLNIDNMSIERVETVFRRNWWSCTCSESSLFLSTYEHSSSIMEFCLQPSIEFIKEWKSPLTCRKDEFIKDIVYNNQTIAITIFNKKTFRKRFELKSLRKFDLLWSLDLDIRGECHNTLRCCSLPDNQWLLTDFDNQRLFHIRNDGKLKTIYPYPTTPWYINLFTSNILVISTQTSVNFHKI
ncbi:unnamed protein product [Adineta ricciae]|uniref:Uncharacterized protein n=1 Tax=Adineta ricciae TaxID=249248 RepID=A0A815I1B2_ADIRI|nr:unnamed protein product [Adineta ricciae]CAF1516770.1 unnamed protein product [Adineta ricciae]